MAKGKRTAGLPPPTVQEAWAEFLKWALGVPMVCAGGLGLIAGALWLAGGQELMWRATVSMGEALFWIAAIALMYPFLLIVWIADLRGALRAARDWAAMPPEAQVAAMTEAVARPGRPARKKG